MTNANAKTLPTLLDDYEFRLICIALARTKGCVAYSADLLQVKRVTLMYRIKRLKLRGKTFPVLNNRQGSSHAQS